jgi:hypothetical protein
MVRNQDDEFNYRVLEGGGRILLAPAIRSRYLTRSTWRRLCSQYAQYGFWKVRVMQKHPGQMRVRQFVAPAFVASVLTLLALAPASPVFGWLLVALSAVYVAANLAASALAGPASDPAALLRVPFAFTVLHVSWGAGFLAGLIALAARRSSRLLQRHPAHSAIETPPSGATR